MTALTRPKISLEEGGRPPATRIAYPDLRRRVYRERRQRLLLFLLDTSGSMAAERRLSDVKAAVLAGMQRAYQRRDRFALMIFRRDGAELVLSPGRSLQQAKDCLEALPAGGATPLAKGIQAAADFLRRWIRKSGCSEGQLILLTDGRANRPRDGWARNGGPWQAWQEAVEAARLLVLEGTPLFVVDTEAGWVRFGLARRLAELSGATYRTLEELRREGVA